MLAIARLHHRCLPRKPHEIQDILICESVVCPGGEDTRVAWAPKRGIGMRWWLGLAFVAVAAVTATAVVSVLSARSEHAFRTYAREFALGNSVTAAEALKHDRTLPALRRDLASIVARRRLALFAFDSKGRLITPTVAFGLPLASVPGHDQALRTALSSNRYIQGSRDGSTLVVGLPVHGGTAAALVAYSLRPELAQQLGLVQNQFLKAALLAVAVGGIAGLIIATLIAVRLGRIAGAAKAIGEGDFSVEALDRFPDEVGSLGASIDSMRLQLQSLVQALHDDRHRLERLLDRLDEGVLLIDRSLHVDFSNGRATELLAFPKQAEHQNLADLPHGKTVVQLAQDLFSQQLANQIRLTVGEQVLLISGIPPSASDEHAIIVVADESLRELCAPAQREFATNAAHELRTPLSSIVSAIEMLQTGAKEDRSARDSFLAIIENESARLTRLTRALLVLARAEADEEAPRLSPVLVRPILEHVAEGLPPHPDVDVTIECSLTLTVCGDSHLLEQALASIAANAVQHTKRGSVSLRARVDDSGVVIEIADTGPGIALHDQRRIFDRFYRGNGAEQATGFGLGLSIARAAVRHLGGTVELDSEEGTGTTVRLTFPAAHRIREVV
jgi:signal transduction histidine kinase/HAMP domain-containing protein